MKTDFSGWEYFASTDALTGTNPYDAWARIDILLLGTGRINLSDADASYLSTLDWSLHEQAEC